MVRAECLHAVYSVIRRVEDLAFCSINISTNPVTPGSDPKAKFYLPAVGGCFCVGTAVLPWVKNCYFPKDQMKFFTYGNTGKQKSWLFWFHIAFCLGSAPGVVLSYSVDLGRRFLQHSSTVRWWCIVTLFRKAE